jgi:MFS family permease
MREEDRMGAGTLSMRPSLATRALILLGATPVAVAFSTMSPILPKMSAALAHDATNAYLVKMLIGIVGISMVMGGPVLGALFDRAPRRPFLVGAALAFAALGVAPYFLTDLTAMLVTRFFMGIAAMTLCVGAAAMVGDCFAPEERPHWMGLYEAGAMLGGVATLFLAGLLGDLGWRQPFLLYLLGVPLALLAWFGAKTSKPSRNPAAHATRSDISTPMRTPWGLVLLGVLIGIITYVPTIYIPFHLNALGLRQPSAIARVIIVGVLVSSVLATQFGRLRRRLSATGAFCCSFAAMAAGLGLIALASSYSYAILGMFVMGLGLAWLPSNLMACAVEAVDESRRGRSVGLVRAAHALAPALGVTAAQGLSSHVGIEGILLSTALLAVMMLIGVALVGVPGRPSAVVSDA